MPRYPHIIKPSTNKQWPNHVLIVETSTQLVGNADSPIGRFEHLDTYWCSAFILDGQNYYESATAHGHTSQSFWSIIGSWLTLEGKHLIVSYDTVKQWERLDWWLMLECQDIYITESDWCSTGTFDHAMNKARSTMKDPLESVSCGAMERYVDRNRGILVTQNPPTIAVFKLAQHNRTLTWIDTQNYSVSPPQTVRGTRDCIWWVSEWWKDFKLCSNKWGLGKHCLTSGSQAMAAWRTTYYHPRVDCHNDKSILQLEEQSLCGGRAECFFIGECKVPIKLLDFRSMYPWVCSTKLLPARVLLSYGERELHELGICRTLSESIARVWITTDEPAYPIKTGNKTSWPIGNLDAVLCGPELVDCYRHNRIKRILHGVQYAFEPFMMDFAVALYQLRCWTETLDNEGMKSMVKAMLVSLPGKLAQRDRKWIPCPEQVPVSYYGEWAGSNSDGTYCRYRSIAGNVERESIQGFAYDAVPAAASFITSFARMRLLEAIRIATWAGVYYCDTDSVFVDADGLKALKLSGMVQAKELGMLDIKEEPENLSLLGIKHYITDDRIVCSGNSLEFDVAAIEAGTAYRDETIQEQLMRGERPHSAKVKLERRKDTEYRHGTLCDDGRVKPEWIKMW